MAHRRQLGPGGASVFPLCLGGNVFGWGADRDASFAVLDAYLDAGGNFVDTANVYSAWVPGNEGGESERLIGEWLRASGARGEVVIASKVGMAGGVHPKGLSRDKIRRGLEGSMARLGVDRLDVLFAHEDDADTPLEETVAAFDEVMAEGLVGAVGASNYTAERLRAALDVAAETGRTPFSVVQPRYSLMDRGVYEGDLAELCVEEGLGVTPYFSLARGFLTGKYRPGRELPQSPRAAGVVRDYLDGRGESVLAELDAVAGRHEASPAQVALAWLLARPGVTAPIASATSPAQARELVGAVDLELSADEVASLAGASAVPS